MEILYYILAFLGGCIFTTVLISLLRTSAISDEIAMLEEGIFYRDNQIKELKKLIPIEKRLEIEDED